MKKIVVLLFLSFAIFSTYGQSVTKNDICKGAAVSIVYTIAPAIKANMDKAMIKEMSNEAFTAVAQPSVMKAYDLLISGKSKEEVIEVLHTDFMAMDDSIVFQGLLTGTD